MCLIQIKHAQIKFPLVSFWTVWIRVAGVEKNPGSGIPDSQSNSLWFAFVI
jgi:hypothetical protein